MAKKIAIIVIFSFWLITALSIGQSMIQARDLQQEINVQRNIYDQKA